MMPLSARSSKLNGADSLRNDGNSRCREQTASSGRDVLVPVNYNRPTNSDNKIVKIGSMGDNSGVKVSAATLGPPTSTVNAVVVRSSDDRKSVKICPIASLQQALHSMESRSSACTRCEIAAPPNTPVSKQLGSGTVLTTIPLNRGDTTVTLSNAPNVIEKLAALGSDAAVATTSEGRALGENGQKDSKKNKVCEKRTTDNDVAVLADLSFGFGMHLLVVTGSENAIERRLLGCPTSHNIPFPVVVHKMVSEIHQEDPSIVRWEFEGEAFFMDETHKDLPRVLALYFNHAKYASLHRQLNKYGWSKGRRGTKYAGRFYHPSFHRDMPRLAELSRIRPHQMPQRVDMRPRARSTAGQSRMFDKDWILDSSVVSKIKKPHGGTSAKIRKSSSKGPAGKTIETLMVLRGLQKDRTSNTTKKRVLRARRKTDSQTETPASSASAKTTLAQGTKARKQKNSSKDSILLPDTQSSNFGPLSLHVTSVPSLHDSLICGAVGLQPTRSDQKQEQETKPYSPLGSLYVTARMDSKVTGQELGSRMAHPGAMAANLGEPFPTSCYSELGETSVYPASLDDSNTTGEISLLPPSDLHVLPFPGGPQDRICSIDASRVWQNAPFSPIRQTTGEWTNLPATTEYLEAATTPKTSNKARLHKSQEASRGARKLDSQNWIVSLFPDMKGCTDDAM